MEPENANDRYERLAAEFYKDTGLMAPGKDYPAGGDVGLSSDPMYRAGAWEVWLKLRKYKTAFAGLDPQKCMVVEKDWYDKQLVNEPPTVASTKTAFLQPDGAKALFMECGEAVVERNEMNERLRDFDPDTSCIGCQDRRFDPQWHIPDCRGMALVERLKIKEITDCRDSSGDTKPV